MKGHLSLAAGLLLVTLDGRACIVQPPEQGQPVAELLRRTNVVVLAKAVQEKRHSDFKATYTLEVVESIRGTAPKAIQVVGFPYSGAAEETTFADHTARAFWNGNWVGRAPMSTDCKLYPPFTIGGTYLVFVDHPYHVKGFERIDNPRQDRWLKYVRAEAGR